MNLNEKCPYIKIKTNKSLQKSEYFEEASDKCELNDNSNNWSNIVCENNNKSIKIFNSGEILNNKENQSLQNIDCDNILSVRSICDTNIKFNSPDVNNIKKIFFNDEIIDSNTGFRSKYSHNCKKVSYNSIVSENTFSLHIKKHSQCEIQNKVNEDNDLYFSHNSQVNNDTNNNQMRLNKGIIIYCLSKIKKAKHQKIMQFKIKL